MNKHYHPERPRQHALNAEEKIAERLDKEVPFEDVLIPIYFSVTAPKKRGTIVQSREGKAHITNSASLAPTNPPTKKRKTNASSGARLPTPGSSARNNSRGAPNGRESLASCAVDILSASCLRQHTFGLLVEFDWVTLFYFDRGGVVSSPPVNLGDAAGKETFFQALKVLLNLGRAGWGFISAFSLEERVWPTRDSSFSFELEELLDNATMKTRPKKYDGRVSDLRRLNSTTAVSFLGRATMVYSFDAGVLKLSWQPVHRTLEASFLADAHRANVPGIPRALAAGSLGELSRGVRGRLTDSELEEAQTIPEHARRTLQAILLDVELEPLSAFPIREKPVDFLKILKELLISASFVLSIFYSAGSFPLLISSPTAGPEGVYLASRYQPFQSVLPSELSQRFKAFTKLNPQSSTSEHSLGPFL